MTSTPQAPVAVVGTTTWGTTLGLILARRGAQVRLLARTPAEADRLSEAGEHPDRMPGFPFPDTMSVTADWQQGLEGVGAVIFAVPSHTMRDNVRQTIPHLSGHPILITGAKGLERD
ncbi:MAG: glycerol-3-phosphate dehydrogenase, partial [Dehalococcoidia bacterium]